jgi:transposase
VYSRQSSTETESFVYEYTRGSGHDLPPARDYRFGHGCHGCYSPCAPASVQNPIHIVPDNDAAYKHPKDLDWLARQPRRTFHFTPTSASRLNAVESSFSKMTRQRIRRGVFRSIADLQAAINAFSPSSFKPFVWTKSAETILAKLERWPVPSVWIYALDGGDSVITRRRCYDQAHLFFGFW